MDFLTLKEKLEKNKQINDEFYQCLEILVVLKEGKETKQLLPVIGKLLVISSVAVLIVKSPRNYSTPIQL